MLGEEAGDGFSKRWGEKSGAAVAGTRDDLQGNIEPGLAIHIHHALRLIEVNGRVFVAVENEQRSVACADLKGRAGKAGELGILLYRTAEEQVHG